MNSFDLKRYVAHWLRYGKQCPLVALEAPSRLLTFGELADVLAITPGRHLIEVEVKVSLEDFRKDGRKLKHQAFRKMAGMSYKQRKYNYFGTVRVEEPKDLPTRLFYFAVPKSLGVKVALECDNLFPYAGVIGFPEAWEYEFPPQPESYRKARVLTEEKLSLLKVVELAKAQSATVCRLLDAIASRK